MSFLRNYMTFTAGSEVAENYHFWSGIFALSAIVNRRVWINMGAYNLYPNLYIILLGPPGSGKDLAMDTSRLIVEDIGGVKFSGDAQTKESLVRYLRDDCPVTITVGGAVQVISPIAMFATELSHLLGPNSGHMIDFLTTIYTKDKRYVTKTKNKGDDIIERPFLGLLAGTTRDWITTYLKSDIIGGGFTRRVIFVNEPARASIKDKSLRRPFLVISSDQISARKQVLERGEFLKSVVGEFTWSPEAKEAYTSWYMTRDIPDDPDVQAYYLTKPNQVIKVAMLVSLSESNDLILQKEHWDIAMALLEKSETNLTQVFQGIGRNELNAVANKLLDYLAAAPKVKWDNGGTIVESRMMSEAALKGLAFRDGNGSEYNEILTHLIATEKVARRALETEPGKPQRVMVILKV